VNQRGGQLRWSTVSEHQVRKKILLGVAVLLLALFAWLGVLTGGWGLAAIGMLATAGVLLLSSKRKWHRNPVWSAAFAVIISVLAWNATSLAIYAIPDNGDTFSSRVATWGRDHGFSPLIDKLEAMAYRTPPSKAPAQSLGLNISVPPTTAPASTTTAPRTDTTGDSVPATSTTADATNPQPPAPLTPIFSPALAGEGQWTPIAQAGGHDTLWATSLRPLKAAGGVVATMVAIDQTYLRASMFNGTEEPGGGPWKKGNHVPITLQPALIATMNGGFRFEHIKGGYMNEGKVVKPLKQGDATIAIDKTGKMVMGKLGRDLQDDGSWASMRQNLELIVDNGASNVAQGIANGVWWGADNGNAVYVKRSGVCSMPDGRLAYVLVDQVDAEQFAQSLIALGCTRAMQLDINVDWPSFAIYNWNGTKSNPHFVDKRMSGNLRRYVDGSTKEFFAFFDRAQVATGTVLDS
jgi:hypothetical protein